MFSHSKYSQIIKCDFGPLNDKLICDCIVCGIESDSVWKHLLHEKKLMLDSAVNICLLYAQSEKITEDLKHEAEVCAITSLINSRALLSINNATTVVNGTSLQSVEDHTKYYTVSKS